MQDKYDLYAKRSDLELRRLRSQKYNRCMRLIGKKGWFSEREELALREQIHAIDVELERRAAQPRLFE